MENSGKKRNIIIIICALIGIFLIGAAVAATAVSQKKNPLEKGLTELAEEVLAVEAEMGEGFWIDAVNQAGSGDVRAEYFFDVSGISGLQNMTVGLDGEIKRDMEQQLFGADVRVSAANVKLADISFIGTADLLYLQMPALWEGSVVLEPEDIDGQWNNSSLRGQLQQLTGEDIAVGQKTDVRLFERFSLPDFSVAGFLEENAEALKALYENMEVIEAGKAQKDERFTAEQLEDLNGYVPKDKDGTEIETACYVVVLPEEELGKIFPDVVSDIRLGVYLDEEERIVRICTLPGEILTADAGKGEFALNLTGSEATVDVLELTASGTADAAMLSAGLSGEIETECDLTIEKDDEQKGSYNVEGNCSFRNQTNMAEILLEGNLRGEQAGEDKMLSVTVERMTVKAQDETVCRLSGRAAFEPLTEDVAVPVEKEYRIGEMNEPETILFLAECMENFLKNYSGYIKLLQ